MAGAFRADMERIRDRARAEMWQGAIAEEYGADDILDLLQYFD